jgi:cell division protein FtsI/penicillin-binding protein 2
MDMRSAIERSCNTYFWATGLVTDPQRTTEMVNYLGYGEEFDLPIPTQRYGTMPSPDWLEKKYHRKWQGYDSANTSIGQGYVLINPMQLAVMPARLGAGKLVQPRLLMAGKRNPIPSLDVDPAHLAFVRDAMSAVVNERGTAVASKLPLDGILMAGKTGTAQVSRLGERGHQSNWALRDHALFIAFAPADKPRNRIPALDVDPEHLEIVRKAMTSVVNDRGTAVASRLPLDGVQMAGKTGTAQVFRLGERGHQSNWALRDHALFIAFAPADKPRYAIGCIIEHGGFGASAAAPIVRDSMTYLFDQQKALAALAPLEQQWGGTLAERNARQLAAFKSASRSTSA